LRERALSQRISGVAINFGDSGRYVHLRHWL
jgi:hypothetical protein